MGKLAGRLASAAPASRPGDITISPSTRPRIERSAASKVSESSRLVDFTSNSASVPRPTRIDIFTGSSPTCWP